MMILHIAHMPSSYAELGEGNYDAAKREYEIVLEHSIWQYSREAQFAQTPAENL